MSQFELVRILHALCYPTTVEPYDERSESGRSRAVSGASYRIIRTLDLGLLPSSSIRRVENVWFNLLPVCNRHSEQDGTECVTVLRV